MIIMFRGKAATGKTLVAKKISEMLNINVISKDSVFDILLIEGYSWNDANSMAYDKLASIISRYHDDGNNLIVDLGLAHTEYYEIFLSKMTLHKSNLKAFLFICSDENLWNKRIQDRISNSSAPNQAFTSVDHAREHYGKYVIVPIENEIVVDSAMDVTEMVDMIIGKIDC